MLHFQLPLQHRAAQPSCFYFEGYDTLVGLDADLGDLGRVDGNVSMARVACELVPNCVGFNSKGWLKANLTDWKNDSSVCTYVRQGGRGEFRHCLHVTGGRGQGPP